MVQPLKTLYIVGGGIVGIVLTVLPMMFRKRQHLIPSPAGVGLAWPFHWYYGVLCFLGALLSFWLERKHPRVAEESTCQVASGWIAGESLMGVALLMCEAAPVLVGRLFRQ